MHIFWSLRGLIAKKTQLPPRSNVTAKCLFFGWRLCTGCVAVFYRAVRSTFSCQKGKVST